VTLWDVTDVYRQWQHRPPLHWLVQAYFGYGKTEKAKIVRRGSKEHQAQQAKFDAEVERLMRFVDQANATGAVSRRMH
jgi:hypothetical protein